MANGGSNLHQGPSTSKFFLGGLVEFLVVVRFDFYIRDMDAITDLLFEAFSVLLKHLFELLFEILDFALENSLVSDPTIFGGFELLLKAFVLLQKVFPGPTIDCLTLSLR
jgi:hypothetical protein